MSTLDPQLLDALFDEYFKDPSFVDIPKGAGYCVFLTLRDGSEKVIRAPSYKYIWDLPRHAKQAVSRGFNWRICDIYAKITGKSRNDVDISYKEVKDYFWTRLKIKRLVDKGILSAINLLKQTPPDVVGALDILEKL